MKIEREGAIGKWIDGNQGLFLLAQAGQVPGAMGGGEQKPKLNCLI